MQKIDLKDWTLLSNRVASSNYISPDMEWLLKFYHSLTTDEMALIKKEQSVAKAVLDMGIPTPKPGEIVEVEGGYGVLFENIRHKVSISRGISQDLSRMPELIKKFCDTGKIIHSTPCDTSKFPAMDEALINSIKQADAVYTDDEKTKLINFVNSIPKTTTCLHGDFHPGNFITGDQGDFTIDLGDFSYGNELYDCAQWWFLSHCIPEKFVTKTFHMAQAELLKCWDMSIEMTFGSDKELLSKKLEIISELGKFMPVRFIGVMPMAQEDLKITKKQIKVLNA